MDIFAEPDHKHYAGMVECPTCLRMWPSWTDMCEECATPLTDEAKRKHDEPTKFPRRSSKEKV